MLNLSIYAANGQFIEDRVNKQISRMNRNIKNPQKPPLTAKEINRSSKWGNIQFQECEYERLSSLRPHTTPLVTRIINESLNTTGRSSNFVHLRSVSAVQNQLHNRYQEDMSSYLRNKLHKIVEKRQGNFIPDSAFSATLNVAPASSMAKHTKPRRPLDYFYTSLNNESKLQPQKGVEEAYLVTAKEKIIRLIDMKKKQQSQYRTLSSKIKTRSLINSQAKGKNRFGQFKKQTIEEEDWDKEWRQECGLQNKRYRNRLLVRCNKQKKMFLSIQH